MNPNSHIAVDGITIPVGQTLRGRPAREALPSLLAMPGLRHIERIDPAGNLSVSAGLHPPRIAETLPASAAGEERRRQLHVLMPSGAAWVHVEVPQTVALVGMLLADRGAAGVASADRLAFIRAAGGALDWTRRVTDLRAIGCVVSIVVFRNGGDRSSIVRMHSRLTVDGKPNDGLPVIEAETIVARAYVDAAVQQASAAHARYRHHLTGLVDRGRRWRLGTELQARLAAAGLMSAEGRP